MLRRLLNWIRRGLRGYTSATVEANPAERRRSHRYPVAFSTLIQPAPAPDDSKYQAEVFNVSQGGIGLRAAQGFHVGALLHVSLPQVFPDEQRSGGLLACVVHVSRPTQERWSLGCSFIRDLSADELEALSPS